MEEAQGKKLHKTDEGRFAQDITTTWVLRKPPHYSAALQAQTKYILTFSGICVMTDFTCLPS